MCHIPFNDKEKMMDTLNSQKNLTGGYNTFANEAATPEVKSGLMSILNEEHDIQHELWCEINSRGWYPVEKADENKLNTTKTKFSTMA